MAEYIVETMGRVGPAPVVRAPISLPWPMGLKVTGVLLILFGSWLVILGLCGYVGFHLASGLIAGLLFIIAGIVGIRTTLSIRAQKGHLVAYLVLTVIFSLAAFAVFIVSCIFAAEMQSYYFDRILDCLRSSYYTGVLLNVSPMLHAAVSGIGFITLIVASAYSCVNLRRYCPCCCSCCGSCCEKGDVVVVPASYFASQANTSGLPSCEDEIRFEPLPGPLVNDEHPPKCATNSVGP